MLCLLFGLDLFAEGGAKKSSKKKSYRSQSHIPAQVLEGYSKLLSCIGRTCILSRGIEAWPILTHRYFNRSQGKMKLVCSGGYRMLSKQNFFCIDPHVVFFYKGMFTKQNKFQAGLQTSAKIDHSSIHATGGFSFQTFIDVHGTPSLSSPLF